MTTRNSFAATSLLASNVRRLKSGPDSLGIDEQLTRGTSILLELRTS